MATGPAQVSIEVVGVEHAVAAFRKVKGDWLDTQLADATRRYQEARAEITRIQLERLAHALEPYGVTHVLVVADVDGQDMVTPDSVRLEAGGEFDWWEGEWISATGTEELPYELAPLFGDLSPAGCIHQWVPFAQPHVSPGYDWWLDLEKIRTHNGDWRKAEAANQEENP